MITSLRTRLGAGSSFVLATVTVAILIFPGTAGAQQVARRFGVGVGIGDVHNIFATSAVVTTEDAVAAPAILFPIQITDWYTDPSRVLLRASGGRGIPIF